MVTSNSEALLFTSEGGEWRIYRASYAYAGSAGNVAAYAYHRCQDYEPDKESWTNCWHLGDVRRECILCDMTVPDGIQALITLYTWGES